MQIWIDADACPNVIKQILFRASERTGIALILVANHTIPHPPLAQIRSVRVSAGFDVADNYIVSQLEPGDLVITADIPLAAEVIDADCVALNPRGELYTQENVRHHLSMRDFMTELRSSGVETGGPSVLGPREKQDFANQLDRFIAQHS